MQDDTRTSLDSVLHWSVGECSDQIQNAFKTIILMHLANADEWLVDALAHVSEEGWTSAAPYLTDLWTDAVGEVVNIINGSVRVVAMETVQASMGGVPEGMAA